MYHHNHANIADTDMDNLNTVVVTCAGCGGEHHIPRWMFEIDIEEEGEDYEYYCTDCLGHDDPP